MSTVRTIVENLRFLGIEQGDRLLIHSSFKSLGYVEGGIETLLCAFREAVGKTGTLMFPTFTYDFVNAQSPIFNIKTTPSCVGMIPEVFRHEEGVLRSLHPTHSLAVWGADKEFYVDNHHADQTCLGINSPIYKLKESGGKILHIGCGLSHNTILHGLEIHCKVPYAFAVDYSNPLYHREYVCIDENGISHKREFFHVFARPSGWTHKLDRVTEFMEVQPMQLLQAQTYLFDARELWDKAEAALRRDPYCLAEPTEK